MVDETKHEIFLELLSMFQLLCVRVRVRVCVCGYQPEGRFNTQQAISSTKS
jgi:hypothetical protein